MTTKEGWEVPIPRERLAGGLYRWGESSGRVSTRTGKRSRNYFFGGTTASLHALATRNFTTVLAAI